MTPEQRQESALRTTGCTTSTKNISTGLPEYFETQNTLKTLVPKSRLELTTEWALKPGGLQVPVSLATGKEAGMEARCMDTRPPPQAASPVAASMETAGRGRQSRGLGSASGEVYRETLSLHSAPSWIGLTIFAA